MEAYQRTQQQSHQHRQKRGGCSPTKGTGTGKIIQYKKEKIRICIEISMQYFIGQQGVDRFNILKTFDVRSLVFQLKNELRAEHGITGEYDHIYIVTWRT